MAQILSHRRKQRRRTRCRLDRGIVAAICVATMLPILFLLLLGRRLWTTKAAHNANGFPMVNLNESIEYSINRFTPLNNRPTTLTMQDFNFTLLRASTAATTGKTAMVEDARIPWQQVSASLVGESSPLLSQPPVCQVFCRFPIDSFGVDHFPHFVQQAYPCWSLLQRFKRTARHFYMVINVNYDRVKTPYIQSFLTVLRRSELRISILYGNATWPVDTYGCGKDSSVSLVAVKNVYDNGFDGPVRYFMNEMQDVQQLQKAVLRYNYIATPGPSLSWWTWLNGNSKGSSKANVVILDRQGSTRDWAFSNQARQDMEATLGSTVHVTYIDTFTAKTTLWQQAYAMHTADVVVSPHGAQLANLAYIRPCTIVIEVFAPRYYLQFFASLVVSAGGLAYEGYPANRADYRAADAQTARDNADLRGVIRSVRILASPNSLIQRLPDLLAESETCRKKWYDATAQP